jgi:hypothetical protein
MYLDGSALNIRPCPPRLREELRGLANDAGQSLYHYVVGVLQAHVEANHRPWATPAEPTPAQEYASA